MPGDWPAFGPASLLASGPGLRCTYLENVLTRAIEHSWPVTYPENVEGQAEAHDNEFENERCLMRLPSGDCIGGVRDRPTMTPAINRPSLPATLGVHALKPARTLVPASHHAAEAQHPGRGRRDAHHPTLLESEYVGSPYCERCGTDEFIYLETFVPATHRQGRLHQQAWRGHLLLLRLRGLFGPRRSRVLGAAGLVLRLSRRDASAHRFNPPGNSTGRAATIGGWPPGVFVRACDWFERTGSSGLDQRILDESVRDVVRRAEAVRRDADGLLVQERQQLHAAGLGDRVGVDGQVRAAAGCFGQRRGVAADQPDAAAGQSACRRERPADASQSASFSTVTAMPSPDSTARSRAGSSTAADTVSAEPARTPAATVRTRWASGSPSDRRTVTGSAR